MWANRTYLHAGKVPQLPNLWKEVNCIESQDCDFDQACEVACLTNLGNDWEWHLLFVVPLSMSCSSYRTVSSLLCLCKHARDNDWMRETIAPSCHQEMLHKSFVLVLTCVVLRVRKLRKRKVWRKTLARFKWSAWLLCRVSELIIIATSITERAATEALSQFRSCI